MKKISEEELKDILENHKHWLSKDCEGWENMRADLSYADLRHADLSYANLSYANLSYANLEDAILGDANLYGADLSYANLSYANLSYANLEDANLRYANLSYANLEGANLRYANLYGADLEGANLRGAYLSSANLYDAYLSSANLIDADLEGANLRNANLIDADLEDAILGDANLYGADLRDAKNVPYIPMVCPEEGDFIGWKKAEVAGKNVIVKLKIPASAKRSSATSRKCRCDKAKVLEIYNLDGTVAKERKCHSSYNNEFIYEVGKTVKVDDFNEDRWNECAPGIHFFINRQEAINY